MIEVANLHRQARYGNGILANSSVDGAHLRLELGKDSHDVPEQLRTVVGLHLDIDEMRQTGSGKPLRLHDPFGRRQFMKPTFGQSARLHADAAADRDVPH